MNHRLESVVRYLEEHRLKLVTAESCTAGLVASTLAEIPGSASWLECAFVTYSSESKMSYLGVKPESIERYNLTSEQVAREMAEGALKISRANVALANTGLAGPSGGEGGIPVGTVCFAWSFERDGEIHSFSETRKFKGGRNVVRRTAAEYALSRIWHYHNTLESRADEPA